MCNKNNNKQLILIIKRHNTKVLIQIKTFQKQKYFVCNLTTILYSVNLFVKLFYTFTYFYIFTYFILKGNF